MLKLSPDLLVFVRQSLPSVWALELLLLLRSDPEKAWTPAVLVAELRASMPLVTQILTHLECSGLVLPDAGGAYRYAPAGRAVADLCDQLEAAYRERPVAIIKAISAPADHLQGLADAFRIKGDKP